MPNLKFSQFLEQTDTANVQFLVGYNGSDNVRIAPSNIADLSAYLPLTGGTLTGNLGINVASPSRELDIDGNIQLSDPSSAGTRGLYGLNGPMITFNGLTFDNEIASGAIRYNPVVAQMNFKVDGSNDFLSHDGGTGETIFSYSGSEKMRIEGNGNVGIGTSSPNILGFGKALTISSSGSPALELSIGSTSTFDLVTTNQASYISTRTSIPLILQTSGSEKLRITSAGNVGIGTTLPSTALHVVGAITVDDGNGNTKVGANAGASSTVANQSAFGNSAGIFNAGDFQTAIGVAAGFANTGDSQTAVGYNAGNNNAVANQTAVGVFAGYANFGLNQTAVGVFAGNGNQGNNNSNFGYEAGYYLSDGTTPNTDSSNSVFLGSNTKALGAAQTNQIVIGHNATGAGANSVTLGNDSIVTTYLKGDVGIGTPSPSEKLHVIGNILASGDITAFSDYRIKENIETLPNALESVKQMRGVTYNKIGDEKQSIGVIAQEVKSVLPELVSEHNDGMLSVAYGNITAVLIEAIKEQQKQIDNLKSRLDGFTN